MKSESFIPLQRLLLRKTLLLVLLSVLLVGVTIGYIAWRTQIDTISSGLINIGEQASNSIEAYLNQTLDILRTVSEYTRSKQVPPDQIDYYLETLVRNNPKQFEEITLIGNDGMEIASSRPDSKILDRSEEIRAFLLAGSAEIISAVSVEEGRQIPVMKIILPIDQHGEWNAILFAKVSLRGFWHLFDPFMPGGISFGKTGHGVLIDQQRTIIGHANLKKVFNRETLPVDWSSDHPRDYRFTQIGPSFASASYIETTRWWLVVMMEKREAYTGATKSLIMSLGITILLAFLLWYSSKPISARISTPIKDLSQGTRRIADGDFSVRLERNSNIREVTDLTDHFNKMAGQLQDTLDKLRRADRLAALGAMASVVAHEIRNPLTSIVALSNHLKKQITQGNLEFLDEFDDVVPNELKRLNGILEDFLDFARPRPPELDWRNLNDVITDTVNFFKAGIPAEDVHVVMDLQPHIPSLQLDSQKMRQVFLNLGKNALEALPEKKGNIIFSSELETSCSPPCVNVRICDTGSGIPEKVADRLFEPFATTKSRGSGLGLAICRRIVEEHGATIVVESSRETGTVFKISFPVQATV
ncbi:MAG: HAMP domain-containing protein [Candidatus Omnitrophota bacterium]|jgi:signal transduction histidine kinase|nr:MAG: HAMP domain-containing protein [Candidatus Omnitrophota bacterium]